MTDQPTAAPQNKLGAATAEELAALERRLVFLRTAQLDSRRYRDLDPDFDTRHLDLIDNPDFTLKHLQAIHAYTLQDVYAWAGELRDVQTEAMGMYHATVDQMHQFLPELFEVIDSDRPSLEDSREALDQVALHWSTATFLHPMLDGNSRTQRAFFTEYLRDSGWDINWSAVDLDAVHAGRHASFLTGGDPTWLAGQLEPGLVELGDPVSRGALSIVVRDHVHDNNRPKKILADMMAAADQGRDGYTFAAQNAAADEAKPTGAQLAARLASRGVARTSPSSQQRTSSTSPPHRSPATSPRRKQSGPER